MNTWPNGETRAYIGPDYQRYRGIAITLVNRSHNGTVAIGLPAEIVFQDEEAPGAYRSDQQPTLRIPDDLGRAPLIVNADSMHR